MATSQQLVYKILCFGVTVANGVALPERVVRVIHNIQCLRYKYLSPGHVKNPVVMFTVWSVLCLVYMLYSPMLLWCSSTDPPEMSTTDQCCPCQLAIWSQHYSSRLPGGNTHHLYMRWRLYVAQWQRNYVIDVWKFGSLEWHGADVLVYRLVYSVS